VAPTVQLARLMNQLSTLLQQHAAGSFKLHIFCEILKLLKNYVTKFINFSQNKKGWIIDFGATDQ
jgi:hypothetical protein